MANPMMALDSDEEKEAEEGRDTRGSAAGALAPDTATELFALIESGIGINSAGFTKYVRSRLGLLDVTPQDVDRLLAAMAPAAGVDPVLLDFQRWWSQHGENGSFETTAASDTSSGTQQERDNAVRKSFCRGLRADRFLRRARASLLSSWAQAGTTILVPGAQGETLALFEACRRGGAFNATAVAAVAGDLGLDLDLDHAERVIAGIDKTANGKAEAHEFEVWWDTNSSCADGPDARFRLFLILCALLDDPSSDRAVTVTTDLARTALEDLELRRLIDQAVSTMQGAGVESITARAEEKGLREASFSSLEGQSCGIFDASSTFRRAASRLITNKHFESGILCCIAVNIAAMASAQPGLDSALLAALNLFVIIVLCLETGLRIVAGSLLVGEHAFVRSGWNILDSVILSVASTTYAAALAGIIDSKMGIIAAGCISSTHAIRFFRHARQIVESIGQSAGTLWLIFELMLAMFLCFGIIGRELLGGVLSRSCADDGSLASGGTVVCPLALQHCGACVTNLPVSGVKARNEHTDKIGFDS